VSIPFQIQFLRHTYALQIINVCNRHQTKVST
jgi:hypothetical protein